MEEELPTLLKPTVWLEANEVIMLDRRKLPESIEFIKLKNYEEVAKAIEDMVIQGAGTIAIAAGYALALTLLNQHKKENELKDDLYRASERLKRTRPTGSSLVPFVESLTQIAVNELNKGENPLAIVTKTIEDNVVRRKRAAEDCGKWAATLLEDDDTILTHCFAGPALVYMLMEAKRQGKKIKVFATETRPYLQGARLTSFTLKEAGIPTTLITDNMVAYCMWKGLVNKVFTAADRIALDGSIANKIGTYLYAISAFHNNIPFYIFGYKGPDSSTKTFKDIPIEERDPEEVFYIRGKRIAARGIEGYYPAFDITPPKFITAIITDNGIFPPTNIKKYLAK